ncbi:hypothetical protein TNCV_4283811 [Trichonephila clavipes]|nr:hypothetical protein TNCV_4283811 [Trichonephila clavipes]
MEWYEQQSKCCPTQLLLLKRIRDVAAKKRSGSTAHCGSWPSQEAFLRPAFFLPFSVGLSTGHLGWVPKYQDKLDLIKFSGNKFRSSSAKGACRSSAPRARNYLESALLLVFSNF